MIITRPLITGITTIVLLIGEWAIFWNFTLFWFGLEKSWGGTSTWRDSYTLYWFGLGIISIVFISVVLFASNRIKKRLIANKL